MAQLTSEEYRKRSKSLLKENKLDEALECINEGLKKGPDDDLTRYKGEVLTKLGRLNEALECYNRISFWGNFLAAAFFLVVSPIGGSFY
jgi:tetratricopeptide (TPR) repeat protein